jgi:Flp pilus assembly pilin Flp
MKLAVQLYHCSNLNHGAAIPSNVLELLIDLLVWRWRLVMFSYFKKRQNAQGLIEYALLLGLIALVVVGVLVVMGIRVRDAYSFVLEQLGMTPEERDCAMKTPPPPVAMRNTSLSADGRTVLLEWKNVNDDCSKVQSYTVYYSNFFIGKHTSGSLPASCGALTCTATITVPRGVQVVWRVEATNRAGTTSGNSKTYRVP